MRWNRATQFVCVFLGLWAAIAATEKTGTAQVIWTDFDMKDIPEPEEREVGFVEFIRDAQIIEKSKQAVDIPRWVRAMAGAPKPAGNVNALGGVPDSSWYTNRHHRHPMSRGELARGPNSAGSVDLTGAVITGAKIEGVTPGLEVEAADGGQYIVKFDRKEYPELQSGAEMISTKIMYAAGYHVPENYLALIDPERIAIGDDVTIPGDDGERPFTRDDLDELLERVAVRPDGKIRVLASRRLEGTPKGPFAYVGTRGDDPNDIIPHEHRRELRGLRVIASWINHWDLKEQNTLDMYVTEDGRRFLRHYFIDFGSSLGAAQDPTEYFHGREYAFDAGSIFKELFSLGLFTSAAEKEGRPRSSAVGAFSADDFDPGSWKPSVPVIPFGNIAPADALWALAIVMSFSREDLEAIVATAEYSDADDAEHMVRTLLDRQRLVADYWTGKAQPLDEFAMVDRQGVQFLTFRDLAVEAGVTDAGNAQYTYSIRRPGHKDAGSDASTTNEPAVPVGTHRWLDEPGDPIEVVIVKNPDLDPVRVLLAPRIPGPTAGEDGTAGIRYDISGIRRD